MAESRAEAQAGADPYKAIEKVLSGCVTKVLNKLKDRGSSSSSKKFASAAPSPRVASDSDADSDDDFVERSPFKKRKAEKK